MEDYKEWKDLFKVVKTPSGSYFVSDMNGTTVKLILDTKLTGYLSGGLRHAIVAEAIEQILFEQHFE